MSLMLSLGRYTESILRRFGLKKCKPACTPMVESFFTGLSAKIGKSEVMKERYQRMIG